MLQIQLAQEPIFESYYKSWWLIILRWNFLWESFSAEEAELTAMGSWLWEIKTDLSFSM